MQIWIDAREAFSSTSTGKGRWTRCVVDELLSRHISIRLLCAKNTHIPEEYVANADILPATGLRWHIHVRNMLRTMPDDCVYLSPTSYIVPVFAPKNARVIPVIHDLIAFRNEPHDRKATRIERLLLPRVVRKASRICTLSAQTTADLLRRYPFLSRERIHTVYAGVSQVYASPAPDATSIVCIATLCPRKNQRRLIEAYTSLSPALQKKHPLVLIGARGWGFDDIVTTAKQNPHVILHGYVSDTDLTSIMRDCLVFAYPSLYEGFGLPVLDAMHAGIPVLTSANGSLAEVAGTSAALIDPYSAEDIAQILQKLLEDPALRSRYSSQGKLQAEAFSWKRTGDLLLDACSANLVRSFHGI